ncbi:hypothetical protein [Aestuariivirga litoralis]|uniref:hypothetical protein n=1 Tax=Aestuariivirga litoralis TaxID=2650924 RepID=UPI0018C83002|nr:hypothetical protein [Aestuariivirga litoralis]MBG1232224.1 hypothetical protein [Aestuariivirga litoralis]
MNSDMLGGIIRAFFPPVLAYTVGAGLLPAGDYGAVVAGVVSLATAIWSVHTNKTGKTIK